MALLAKVCCAAMVRHSPLGNAAEHYLRLINGNYLQGDAARGQYVRIVE